jgi:hypothetical protein
LGESKNPKAPRNPKEPREVKILIGKRTYRIYTLLDDAILARVTSLVNDVGMSEEDVMDQENILMMACMKLAYALERTSDKLTSLLNAIESRS